MFGFGQYVMEQYFADVVTGKAAIVHSLGIITAENPNNKNLTKLGNERKNKEFEKFLEKQGFAIISMKGKFLGKQENPFLLINIDKEKLVEFGKKFKQESVIYAEKKDNKFEFQLICKNAIRKGKIISTTAKTSDDEGCYFSLDGVKFRIKFM